MAYEVISATVTDAGSESGLFRDLSTGKVVFLNAGAVVTTFSNTGQAFPDDGTAYLQWLTALGAEVAAISASATVLSLYSAVAVLINAKLRIAPALTNGLTGLVNGNNVAIDPVLSYSQIMGPTGAFSIVSILAGTDGDVLLLLNTTSQTMTVKHQSATDATAANRIITDTGADLTAKVTLLFYDGDAHRWRMLLHV